MEINEKLSLDDIKNNKEPQNAQSFKPVSIEDIAPYKQDDTIKKNWEREISKIDAAIQRNKQEMYDTLVVPVIEKMIDSTDDEDKETLQSNSNDKDLMIEDDIDKEVEDEPILTSEITTSKQEVVINTNSNNLDNFDDDTALLDEEPEENIIVPDSDNKRNKEYSDEIKNTINPLNTIIDLTKFKISTTPIGISKLITSIPKPKTVISDWALRESKRPISMSAITGIELDKLDISNLTDRSQVNRYLDLFGTLYNHITSPNKPGSVEAWVKSITFMDLMDVYFAVYMASYSKSKFIPHSCDKCKKSFLQYHEFSDLYKFKNEKVKDDFFNIVNSTNYDNKITSTLIQISENYAAAIRIPTLYSTTFEYASLEQSFKDKYDRIINIVNYIENIYFINTVTGELYPVDCKPDPMNLGKSVKRRIKYYLEIFKSITSDQWAYLIGEINKLGENDHQTDIKYIIPATKCKFCGADIPEAETNSVDLLFTRHQLGTMASSY